MLFYQQGTPVVIKVCASAFHAGLRGFASTSVSCKASTEFNVWWPSWVRSIITARFSLSLWLRGRHLP